MSNNLDFTSQRAVKKLWDEIECLENFPFKDKKETERQIEQKRAEIADIYEYGSDY